MASGHGRTVQVEAPAKLNLFLEVLQRRPDGYHEIETLITAITISDTLFCLATEEEEIRVECTWAPGLAAATRGLAGPAALGDLPPPRENLVYRAVERLRQRAGVTQGIHVRVLKRIPSAAGLGGASSDAAAALAAANQVWQLGWSFEQLANLAAELGSDIPFFLRTPTGLAVCRGRGERVEAVRSATPMHFVVVRPPAGLSTPEVYRHCRPAEIPQPVEPVLRALEQGEVAWAAGRLVNRLQPAAEQLSPWIGQLRQLFDRFQVWGHQMSGSGSSYFAVCRSAGEAVRLAAAVRAAGHPLVWTARRCRLSLWGQSA